MRRFLLLFTAAIIAVTCLPLSAMATGSLDKGQPEYAWVLTEVIDHENADGWAQADAHAAYAVSYSYSRGSYSASRTYEGDDPYKEGLKGTLGLQAVFTGIPDIIYPDKPVSLNFSFTTTQNDVVKLSFSGTASADFDQWDVGPGGATGRARWFANADGKDSFTLDVNGNPSAYSETLTATLGTGSEGSRIALRTKFSMGVAMGTNYVYEWKQVGSTAPSSDETPEPSSDEPSGWTPPVYHRPPPVPGLTEGICKIGGLHGEVNVRQNDDDDDAYIFAWSGMELYHNDRVKTLTRSGCIISFSDLSTFVMPEDTTIVLDIANERTSKLGLLGGTIWTNFKNMVEKNGELEIEMSQAIAGARGTTFICEEKDGVSTVKVFEGTVEVTAKATGKSVMVGGGEMLSTDSTGKGTLTMFDAEAELAGWEPYVQQVTAEAMEEADREKGGFPVVIVAVAAILLAAGAVVIVLIARRNKGKARVAPPYATPVQPDGQPSRRFCPNCGNPLGENGKFCGKCGHRLS